MNGCCPALTKQALERESAKVKVGPVRRIVRGLEARKRVYSDLRQDLAVGSPDS